MAKTPARVPGWAWRWRGTLWGPSPGGSARFWNDGPGRGLPLIRPFSILTPLLPEKPRYENIETEPPRVRLTQGVAEFGECEDYRVSGATPDQLHLIDPTPNRTRVGQNGSVIAIAENNFVGLADQDVTFTRLSGNFTFLNGSNPGRAATSISTGPDGRATVSFRGDGAGSALLRATVAGETGDLHAFAVFEIVPGP